MAKSNKFGFAPLETEPPQRRERSVGPMGAAVREAAESLTDATEAKVEKRRQNAVDAEAFRAAQDEGRVLMSLELSQIATDDLPRDRMDLEAVAASDEMEELKASIRERGQKEPIEIYPGPDGSYQLKKGWRRFTALSQLLAETGDARFGTIIARIERGDDGRLARYIDMVEENVVREDLTFAEMAQVVITAAQDDAVGEPDPDALVARLYGSLHKMKKSYIRSFVFCCRSWAMCCRSPRRCRATWVWMCRGRSRPKVRLKPCVKSWPRARPPRSRTRRWWPLSMRPNQPRRRRRKSWSHGKSSSFTWAA